MGSTGIKDRVAIVGMGCTPFGEHWDKSTDDLLIDAAVETYKSAGVEPDAVDAYWLGTMGSGWSGGRWARCGFGGVTACMFLPCIGGRKTSADSLTIWWCG